jgi:hypothetical protein
MHRKEHPDTLTSINNLALVLDSQGNPRGARVCKSTHCEDVKMLCYYNVIYTMERCNLQLFRYIIHIPSSLRILEA